MVLNVDKADLCLQDPGYEEDLYVRSDVRRLAAVSIGDIGLARALDDESIRIGREVALRKAVPDWLGLSMFAGVRWERRPVPPELEGASRQLRPRSAESQ